MKKERFTIKAQAVVISLALGKQILVPTYFATHCTSVC